MLRILDKYILKKLFSTFFVIITVFSMIAVVFDVSEKIDDFLRDDITAHQVIFEYYMGFIPWLFSLLAPILVFISVIYFTSKMASKTEIIPILASGISFARFLRPYIIGGIILTALSLVMSHFVIPRTAKGKVEFEAIIYNHDFLGDNTNIHKEIKPNHYIYIRTFSKSSNIAYNFVYDIIEEGHLKRRFGASTLKWDDEKEKWVARSWHERAVDEKGKVELTQGVQKDTVFSFDFEEFHKRPTMIAAMDYFEIEEYIKEEKAKGSKYVKGYELEQIKRTSIPCSILVLSIIGATISSRKVKGGIGIHLFYGLAIACVYVFLGKVAEVFAVNTPIPTTLAIWIPNILFAGLAVVIYKRSQR
jgi:lipopolysaccharide export system permease protein